MLVHEEECRHFVSVGRGAGGPYEEAGNGAGASKNSFSGPGRTGYK